MVLASALNSYLNLRCCNIFFISDDCPCILSRLDSNLNKLEIRRNFNVFQLMTVLVEINHTPMFAENDPVTL